MNYIQTKFSTIAALVMMYNDVRFNGGAKNRDFYCDALHITHNHSTLCRRYAGQEITDDLVNKITEEYLELERQYRARARRQKKQDELLAKFKTLINEANELGVNFSFEIEVK